MATTTSKTIKIGELLTKVGIISTGDLTEAIQVSKRLGLPIGRVLVISGYLSDAHLEAALEAQSQVKDGSLNVDTAISALEIAFRKGVSLSDALPSLSHKIRPDTGKSRISKLLLDSEIVTKEQLDRALETTFQTGMPLGGTLVLQGVLSPQLLPALSNAQQLIRERKISQQQAVEDLKKALLHWAAADASHKNTTVPDALLTPATTKAPAPVTQHKHSSNKSSINQDALSLLELLKLSNICSEQEIKSALASWLKNPEIASKFLLETGLVSQAFLKIILDCQALIADGTLRPEQATYALNACRKQNMSLEDVLEELDITVSTSNTIAKQIS